VRWLTANSYLVLALVAIGATGALSVRLPLGTAVMISLVVAAVLIIFWVAARRGQLTPANPEKRIRRALGGGRPVVICYYGDFHLGSLVARLVAARAERVFRGRCDFIYVDATLPEAARALSETKGRLGEFVLYDARGNRVEATRWLTVQQVTGLLERSGR
jgi:hypothetical protein